MTVNDREKLAVILPCHNEEGGIQNAVESIVVTAPLLEVDTEIIMVDDGSTDRTVEKMEELCDRYQNCRMHVNAKNLGVGRTVLNTYETIEDGTWVTVMPGDNEVIFKSIENHLAVRHDYDVILGYLQNNVVRTFTRRMASDAFASVVRVLYGYQYRYLNGLKLYRVEAFKGLEVISSGHAFNAELLAKALLRNPDLRIGEVPFLARGRALGRSNAFRPAAIMTAMWVVSC